MMQSTATDADELEERGGKRKRKRITRTVGKIEIPPSSNGVNNIINKNKI